MTVPRPRRALDGAHAELWSFVERSELRIQRCGSCGATRYPAAPACDVCLSGEWSWVPTAGVGTVRSWVTMGRQYFAELPPPYTVVVAELPEGPLVAADLDGDPAALVVDETQVRLVFQPATFADGGEGQVFRWAVA